MATHLRGGDMDNGTLVCSVGLLGRFRLAVGGSSVDVAPAEQILLALLALRGGQPRARAAGMLWPQLDERMALACLRTGVWRLGRHGLRLVGAGADWVGLPDDVLVDVHDLPGELARWCSGGGRTDGDGARWELLPGWSQDWVLMERERVRQKAVHTVEAGGRRALAAGDPARAVVWARLAVDLGPLRESAHRLVVEAYLAAGDPAAARRHGDRARQVLADQLGVAPSPALQRLLDVWTDAAVG